MSELTLVFDDLFPITKQHGQKPRAIFNAKKRKWVGTMYPVTEYKNFKEEVKLRATTQVNKQGWVMPRRRKLSVSVLVYWPEKAEKIKKDVFLPGERKFERCPDIADNLVSGILDAIQKIAIDDDKMIREFYIKRIDTTFKKRIRIRIQKLTDKYPT